MKVAVIDPRELKPLDKVFYIEKVPTTAQFDNFDGKKLETSTWNFSELIVKSVEFDNKEYKDVKKVTVKLFPEVQKPVEIELSTATSGVNKDGDVVTSRESALQICAAYNLAEQSRVHDIANKIVSIKEELDNAVKADKKVAEELNIEVK